MLFAAIVIIPTCHCPFTVRFSIKIERNRDLREAGKAGVDRAQLRANSPGHPVVLVSRDESGIFLRAGKFSTAQNST
jgi:hypothetical protein